MNDKDYNELVNTELNEILNLIEEIDQEGVCEADLISGVLSISLPQGKQYVINKHLPTKKIWMSSPFSGPNYFEYKNNCWINNKNINIIQVLKTEIESIL
ncbi:MAG: iron donor protein CyaY [Alphaproteobacteria bacterium]